MTRSFGSEFKSVNILTDPIPTDGTPRNMQTSELGPVAFDNKANLQGSIVHEELHSRIYNKALRGWEKFKKLRNNPAAEENYVKEVEKRWLKKKGLAE